MIKAKRYLLKAREYLSNFKKVEKKGGPPKLKVTTKKTVNLAVIGGISFLLYGMIGTSGLRILVDSKVDYGKSRNQALTSVIFVTGLSGIAIKIGNIQLTGMVLACVVGMALSLIFFALDRLKLTNDR